MTWGQIVGQNPPRASLAACDPGRARRPGSQQPAGPATPQGRGRSLARAVGEVQDFGWRGNVHRDSDWRRSICPSLTTAELLLF